jgi:hypothetical protein
VLVGLELGLWMDCRDWLKLMERGGGYLEGVVGEVI